MVILYSTPSCVYCDQTKDFFVEHKIKFKEINVKEDKDGLKEMLKQSPVRSVPFITSGGKWVSGFDKQQLKNLLNIK